MTTIGHDEIAVVRSYCDAWLKGDSMVILSHYHQELTLHWPGRHRLGGSHQGLTASINALLALQAITNRTPTRIVDVCAGHQSIIVVVLERWSDDDRTVEVKRLLEFTVRDGKLHTCQVYETDQAAVDEWVDMHT